MIWMNPKSYSFSRFSILLNAPAEPGVYLLHNSARCIYIGETDNIRQSVLGHLRGDTPWITIFNPGGFSFELCSEASRVQRRNELVLQLEPLITSGVESVDDSAPQTVPHAMDFPLARR